MSRLDLEKYWYTYTRHPVVLLLAPVSWLFCAAAVVRRPAYRMGLFAVQRLPVPVIVVGNLTVGGTGKTPLVAWIARFLAERGYRPGLVARGYRGRARTWPQQVRPDSDPFMVGDEPVLLARHCACPMAVGPDRVAAARALLAHDDCDVIVSDDGLQHYRLGRDVEIAVLDGVRRFGNGRCLPAGPLREPRRRIRRVDMVVTNGLAGSGEYAMKLKPGAVYNLAVSGRSVPLDGFRGRTVHAVAGIGRPERFFSGLRKAGVHVIEHPFPDHHPFRPEDIRFSDDLPVLMTEKDAVKCERFAEERYWCVPVEAELHPRFGERLLDLLKSRARALQEEV